MVTVQPRVQAMAWMVASVWFFAMFDALTKYLAVNVAILILIWSRYVIHCAIAIAIFFPARGFAIFKTPRPWAQILRGLLMLGVSLCMMNAAKYLPLAELTALYFTAPLIVLIASPYLASEPFKWQMLAVAMVGFTGVLFIARPGSEVTGPASLLPLAAAFLYAGFQLSTRHFSKTESPITTNIMTGLVGAVVMTLVLMAAPPLAWSSISGSEVFLILLLGVCGLLAQMMLINAFKFDTPARLAPMSYTQLLWAALIGYVVFDVVPGVSALIGMFLIAASGLFLLVRGSTKGNDRPV